MKRKITMQIAVIVVIAAIGLIGYATRFSGNHHPKENTSAMPQTAEEQEMLSTEENLEPDDKRTYQSHLDFPYKDMEFADGAAWKVLKESYSEIDFYGEYQKGNVDEYDFYKTKYHRLLNSKDAYFDKTSGEYMYLSECWIGAGDLHELQEYTYYFFDMDKDSKPELGVKNGWGIMIFKYRPLTDDFLLWNDFASGLYSLIGSGKVSWTRLGMGVGHVYYFLNQNGDIACEVSFSAEPGHSVRNEGDEPVFIAAIPRYADIKEQIKLEEKIKNQAYIDEGFSDYYFRITEEQYNELTEVCADADRLSYENKKEVTFTYEELFPSV